jgi:uncharacterized protein YndB with AHSA1/START domain
VTRPTEQTRAIELAVEVPGTPDEVWAAVATGPGISSWFIPHRIEEREGGEVVMDWGSGFGTQPGRVEVWDPPRRVVFTGAGSPLAYEWLVEARDGGSCVVRLVNSGFGEGEEWDGQFHGMSDGWRLFLENLRLHLTHFRGRPATAIIPTRMTEGPNEAAWQRLCAALGLPADASAGDRVATGGDAPALSGQVVTVAERPAVRAYHLLLDEPNQGTAFVTVEGEGEQVAPSAYLYLYGEVDPGFAPSWEALLDRHFGPAPAPPSGS